MTEPTPEAVAGLAALLRERVGLQVRPDGLASLRFAVRARYQAPAPPPVPISGYLDLLRGAAGPAAGSADDELRQLLPLVTVGKTQFFRDTRQFRALEALLPGLLAACRAQGRPLAIWSAGCSTGEEPCSIALTAAEAGAQPGELELLATDVNPEAVAFARAGRFPARRGRDIPDPLRRGWLVEDGDELVVGPRLRALMGGVQVHNLMANRWPRPLAGAWDLVFCRNVIIYFDTPTAQRVLGGFLEGLVSGGHLFLGSSESLFRMFQGFELVEVARAFLYRRPPAPPAALPPLPGPPRYAPGAVVRQAPPGGAPAADLSSQELLDRVVELLRAGRLAEARERLERHVALADAEAGVEVESGGGADPAVLLTLANLLATLREPEAAADRFRLALLQEPLRAEAHLLHGIHLLGRGRLDEAALALARALTLDPDAALAHYQLGRCRQAQGDGAGARRSFQGAIAAAHRQPAGRSHPLVGHYPDLPDHGAPVARAAAAELERLGAPRAPG